MNILDDIDKIKSVIDEHSISNETRRKQKGEVFTPYEIIVKMLDELSVCYKKRYKKNIFENKELKWFDNSSGIGNFMMVVYYKLNNGLRHIIKSHKKRQKHILENMLYMSEIDNDNVKKCKKIFSQNNKAKLNIYCGDSLTLNIKDEWGIDNIDIILGNPPYQKANNKNNKSRGGKNNTLYIDFMKKSLEIIKISGYLVYIHPRNWRKIGNDVLSGLNEYQIEYLGLNYGGKLFKSVSVNTDIYVIHRTKKNNEKTRIECYDRKHNMILKCKCCVKNIDFIPMYYSDQIKAIFKKINKYGEKRKCIINSSCHKVRDYVCHKDNKKKEHKYKLYNTSGNPYNYFSSKKHIDQNKKKVILSCSGKLSPIYDKGIYGTTQDSMYFLVDNDFEGEQLVKILNSSLYVFLTKICKWGNFRNEQKVFSFLKYPIITQQEITDKYINDFFKLSKNEIDILNL